MKIQKGTCSFYLKLVDLELNFLLILNNDCEKDFYIKKSCKYWIWIFV